MWRLNISRKSRRLLAFNLFYTSRLAISGVPTLMDVQNRVMMKLLWQPQRLKCTQHRWCTQGLHPAGFRCRDTRRHHPSFPSNTKKGTGAGCHHRRLGCLRKNQISWNHAMGNQEGDMYGAVEILLLYDWRFSRDLSKTYGSNWDGSKIEGPRFLKWTPVFGDGKPHDGFVFFPSAEIPDLHFLIPLATRAAERNERIHVQRWVGYNKTRHTRRSHLAILLKCWGRREPPWKILLGLSLQRNDVSEELSVDWRMQDVGYSSQYCTCGFKAVVTSVLFWEVSSPSKHVICVVSCSVKHVWQHRFCTASAP